MKKLFLVVLLITAICPNGKSQIVHSNFKPEGIVGTIGDINWYDLAISEKEKEAIISGAVKREGALTFAVAREVDLDPDNSGVQITSRTNKSSWYLFIRSYDAASLNIIFSKFSLNRGERVFIYDPGLREILGPFTYENNKTGGSLPIAPLQGSELVIEYQFNPLSRGELEVGQIAHDVLGIFGNQSRKDSYFGSSGDCNVDANCDAGLEWQDDKRAIFRIIAGGVQLGTAVMLNNSNQENIAYALTANHVVRNESYAENSIAIFNYESPWCNGPDGKVSYSISGAQLIAENDDIDMAFIKLSEFPPLIYRPYLAGWNSSGTYPASTLTIHHPSGDVKKISIDDNPPVIDSFKEFQSNGFWKVLQWELGTTEGGSSGAPLFNQDHHVVGYLSGGEATCGRSVNDYFARFDIAYDLSENMFESLKPWLDPSVSGTSYLNGRDPYRSNFLDSDTLFNGIGENYFLTEYNPVTDGYSTGFNSDSIISYAEKFTTATSSLLTDVYLYVGDTEYITASDSVSISVLDDNSGPGDVLATSRVPLVETKDTFLLRVDFSDPVPVDGTFYISYQNRYKEPAGSDPRQFALFHGAVQPAGSGYSWFENAVGWHPFIEHPFDPSEQTLYIKVVTVKNSQVNSIDETDLQKGEIVVFPNPFSESIVVRSNRVDGLIESLSIFDLTGKILRTYENLKSESVFVDDLGSLGEGLYLLEVILDHNRKVTRIIKVSGK